MKTLIKKLIVEESGQDLIEYALLAGFISLIAVGAKSHGWHGCEPGLYRHLEHRTAFWRRRRRTLVRHSQDAHSSLIHHTKGSA